jgi:hypothetical protein
MHRGLISTFILSSFISHLAFAAERADSMHGAHAQGRHDTVNMPGLHGRDTTHVEVHQLRELFVKHKAIQRSVVNLPNGIQTLTETDDVDVRESLVGHTAGMLARMESKRDPEVRIQSPTLKKLFLNADAIDTTLELTEKGVKVTQTSSREDVVALLQAHAAEVSDLVDRGMAAVHERMHHGMSH